MTKLQKTFTTCQNFTTSDGAVVSFTDDRMIPSHVFRSKLLFNCSKFRSKFCATMSLARVTMSEILGDVSSDPNFVAIEEGSVKVYQPASVFYNKVQEFNRDLR